jgi:hypothetical protein
VPTADRTKATVRVRIGFDALDPRILPDMGIKVRFLDPTRGATRAPPRLRVPAAALQREGTAAWVWVVEDGRAVRRAVRTGAERDGSVEIASGLQAGEVIVSPQVEGLKDGGRVRPAKA